MNPETRAKQEPVVGLLNRPCLRNDDGFHVPVIVLRFVISALTFGLTLNNTVNTEFTIGASLKTRYKLRKEALLSFSLSFFLSFLFFFFNIYKLLKNDEKLI